MDNVENLSTANVDNSASGNSYVDSVENLSTEIVDNSKHTFSAGNSLQEIEKIILQTIPYAGFPTAINVMNLFLKLKSERHIQEEM